MLWTTLDSVKDNDSFYSTHSNCSVPIYAILTLWHIVNKVKWRATPSLQPWLTTRPIMFELESNRILLRGCAPFVETYTSQQLQPLFVGHWSLTRFNCLEYQGSGSVARHPRWAFRGLQKLPLKFYNGNAYRWAFLNPRQRTNVSERRYGKEPAGVCRSRPAPLPRLGCKTEARTSHNSQGKVPTDSYVNLAIKQLCTMPHIPTNVRRDARLTAVVESELSPSASFSQSSHFRTPNAPRLGPRTFDIFRKKEVYGENLLLPSLPSCNERLKDRVPKLKPRSPLFHLKPSPSSAWSPFCSTIAAEDCPSLLQLAESSEMSDDDRSSATEELYGVLFSDDTDDWELYTDVNTHGAAIQLQPRSSTIDDQGYHRNFFLPRNA